MYIDYVDEIINIPILMETAVKIAPDKQYVNNHNNLTS